MVYLILGSEGLLGRSLTKLLKKENHVLEFDIVNSIEQDLRTKSNLLEKYIEECDFVYFLACDIGGAKYINGYQNTYEFIHNNVSILKETFELIKKHSKPFVFTSSEMANIQSSAYGCIKSIGEFYCKSLKSPIVRLWNIYGIETCNSLKSHVITDFILQALKEKEIIMLTDGQEERQFLYCDDCSQYLLKLAENYNEIPTDQEMHLAGFKWYKIIEIAHEVSAKLSVPVFVGERKDQTHQSFKFEPNRNMLKFGYPQIDIKQGIEIMIEHYKNNFK